MSRSHSPVIANIKWSLSYWFLGCFLSRQFLAIQTTDILTITIHQSYKSFKLFDLSSFRSRAMLLENKLPNRQSNGFQNSPKNVKSSTSVFYIIPSFGDTSKISFSGAIHKLRCRILDPTSPFVDKFTTLAYVVLLTFAVWLTPSLLLVNVVYERPLSSKEVFYSEKKRTKGKFKRT